MITISEHALDLIEDLQVSAQEYVYLKDKGGDNGSCELSSITLQKYISSLETELAALKAELSQYEWQSGHPEDDRDVWVCWNDGLGGKMYESGWYDKNWFDENSMPCNDDAVHAWSEIRPYGGE